MFKFKYEIKQTIKLNKDEFSKLYKSLNPNKEIKICYNDNIKIGEFNKGNWHIYTKKDNKTKCIILHDGHKVVRYTTNIFCKDYINHRGGGAALKLVRQDFETRFGIKMSKAFGNAPLCVLKCVPKQFYKTFSTTKYEGKVSSVDFSSHYPSNICGLLPDANTSIIVDGQAKPTKEYPFAFYINSGHLAIYNELDTRLWQMWQNLNLDDIYRLSDYGTKARKYHPGITTQYPMLKSNKDQTILMKASKYELTDTYNYFYNNKTNCVKNSVEYEDAKLVLNASIGKMHTGRYHDDKYAHLAAVCIARANNKMHKLMSKLNIEDILQIQVDGILYKGGKVYGEFDNYLGCPEQEITNMDCRWDALGKYMIKDKDKVIKIKTQGMNAMLDGRKLEDSTKFSDMDLWYHNKDLDKGVEYEI